MSSLGKVEYLPDAEVTSNLDQQIRNLLTTCFTRPQDVVFQTQRYFRKPYPNRWVIRDAEHIIIAHAGLHELNVLANNISYPIGGVCEVSVHPQYRGNGYVKAMLQCIHTFEREHGMSFSVLYGNPMVYSSSGYTTVSNLWFGSEEEGWQNRPAMIQEMAAEKWPDQPVFLNGPKF